MPEEFSDEDDLPKGSLSKEEDSDFVMEEDDESGSDWEASQRSQKSRSKVGKCCKVSHTGISKYPLK